MARREPAIGVFIGSAPNPQRGPSRDPHIVGSPANYPRTAYDIAAQRQALPPALSSLHLPRALPWRSAKWD